MVYSNSFTHRLSTTNVYLLKILIIHISVEYNGRDILCSMEAKRHYVQCHIVQVLEALCIELGLNEIDSHVQKRIGSMKLRLNEIGSEVIYRG